MRKVGLIDTIFLLEKCVKHLKDKYLHMGDGEASDGFKCSATTGIFSSAL